MLRFSKRFMVTAAVIAGCLACFGNARAQVWRNLGTLPNVPFCAYFWDTAHGVVGGRNFIYYYNSGTWTPSTYPENPEDIQSIRLLKPGLLYAAQGRTQIWVSADSGKTWQLTGIKDTDAQELYLTKDSQVHIVTGWPYGGQLTYFEGGGTFARLDSNICVLTHDDSDLASSYSTDGGETWHPSANGSQYGGFGCCADTCQHVFFEALEPGNVIASVDSGRTWFPLAQQPTSDYDILNGADGMLYGEGRKDVEASGDGGFTWQSIGGPSTHVEDTRLFAFGNQGLYLIAFGQTGSGPVYQNSVWLFDGTGVNWYSHSPIIVKDTIENTCDVTEVPVTVLATGIPWIVHLTVTSRDNSTVVPRDTIVTTGESTRTILFHAVPSFDSARHFLVHAVVQAGCRTFAWDSSLTIFIAPKRVVVSGAYTAIPACDSVLIPVAVNSNFCDSISWDSLSIWGDSNGSLSLDSITVHKVSPGEQDTVWLKYAPRGRTEDEIFALHVVGNFTTIAGSIDTVVWLHGISAPSGIAHLSAKSSDTTTTCKPIRIPIVLHAAPCDRTLWDTVSMQTGFEGVTVGTPPKDTLLPATADTFWITYVPTIPGKQFLGLDIKATDIGGENSIDTFVTVALTSTSSSASIIHHSSSVSITNCSASFVPLILQALPCDSVLFNSCAITVSGSSSFSENLQFPRTLAAGEIDTLLINFPPQNLNGVYIITAHVTGKYLGSVATFDTTIQIRVTFTSSAGALIASDAAVTLDTTSVCAEADTIVTLTNLGCDSITVTGDATTWLPGWSASDPTFPFSLAPDSSFTVRVHYTPSGPAWSQQNVAYNFKDIGGNAHTSSQLVLDVTAISAPAAISLSDTALSLGTFSRCNASGDTTVTLTNLGCDSLTISSATLAAGTGFILLAGGDTVLAPNQSATFEIAFADSVAGSYATALHITAIGAHGGAELDTTIPVTASVIAGSRLAALSTQNIALDTTSICEELDSSITITNTGCEPDTITAITFANASFASLPSVPSLPIIIPPNGKVTIPLTTAVDTTGHATTNTDTLTLSGNLDAPLAPVLLSRGLTYPQHFAMSLAAPASAPPGRTVPVYVLRTGTVPASANELDFALTYDDNLLGYMSAVEPDIAMTDSQSLANGLTERSFAMKPATDRDTIATLDFKSYLTKNEQTPITLSGEQFIAAGETSPPCVASLDTNASGTNFTLELACGDSILRAELEGAPPFTITSIVPNPAATSLSIVGMTYSARDVGVQVFDVLGNCALDQQQGAETAPLPANASYTLTPAPYALRLDVSKLPSGIYLLRVSSGGYAVTRRFTIVK